MNEKIKSVIEFFSTNDKNLNENTTVLASCVFINNSSTISINETGKNSSQEEAEAFITEMVTAYGQLCRGQNGQPLTIEDSWATLFISSEIPKLKLKDLKEIVEYYCERYPKRTRTKDEGITELTNLLKLNKITIEGKISEVGTAFDAQKIVRNLYEYTGMVVRTDNRSLLADLKKAGGFTSRNKLTISTNLCEAQGLGVPRDEKEKYNTPKGLGATGQSGVSCAKNIMGAYDYGNIGETNRRRMYIIDTNVIGKTNHSWDMSAIVTKNYPNAVDGTGDEVNLTEAPMRAIVGYLEYSDQNGNDYSEPTYTANNAYEE